MPKDSVKTLLVVVAHPDDEVLGCGATVALRVSQGWDAHLAVVAAGIAGRYADPEKLADRIAAEQAALREEMDFAAQILGFRSVKMLGFPDNRLDTIPKMDLSHALDEIIDAVRPDVIYTHHPGDYNWDHGAVFDAVLMAARADPNEYSPSEIYAFEVPSSTERAWSDPSRAFHPNVWVDISKTLEKKKSALQKYKSEYRPYPHPRSVEGIEYLARKRGLEIGLEAAEAFALVRKVER